MIQSTLQERISALRFKNKLWNRVGTLRSIFSSALGTVSRLSRTKKSWKKFSEVRLLVFGTETTALSNISVSVEVEKFPRSSSSSAGRPRQVAANRARAGEKFLMAHFPASLFMSSLAGSSGTQKVCEATKSRNRTVHHSLIELIASFPPSHPGNRARRQQGPGGPQRSQGQPSQ